ncbi:hypothetical protein F5Y03DRAFT_398713 [Xylaria venustula]|nr:hypothetical protein F5Y03DRAFT_398713 [Xylaria venustula]
MERHQSFEGNLPPRPCLAQQSTIDTLQANQWTFHNNQSWTGFPPQITPHDNFYGYNGYSNHNYIAAPSPHSTLNGPVPLMDHTTAQPPATQLAPTQLGLSPSSQPQNIGFNPSFGVAFGGNVMNGNVFPSYIACEPVHPPYGNIARLPTQSHQDASVPYSSPQQQGETTISAGTWISDQLQSIITKSNVPVDQNTRGLHIGTPVPGKTSSCPRAPKSSRPATGKKSSLRGLPAKDMVGVDLVKMGTKRKRSGSTAGPRAKKRQTPIRPVQSPLDSSHETKVEQNNEDGEQSIPPIQPVQSPLNSSHETRVEQSSATIQYNEGSEQSIPLIQPVKSPLDSSHETEVEQPSPTIQNNEDSKQSIPAENNPPAPSEGLEYELSLLIREFIDADNQRLEEEARQRKEKEEEEEARLAEAIQLASEQPRHAAESCANLRLPGCEYRAQAIFVGSPGPEWFLKKGEPSIKKRLAVYAVARQDGNGVEFKLVKIDSPPREVEHGAEIQFSDIRLNGHFSDMNEGQVRRWSQYLLAAVPGIDDTVTMWTK